MSAGLEGRVVALIARGTELDRAIAVALAEAGADIAISTTQKLQEQEYQTASIANEVWAIGREQFSHVMNAADPAQSQAFAEETVSRLGRLDAVVMIEVGANVADAIAESIGRAAPSSVSLLVGDAARETPVEMARVPTQGRAAGEVAAEVAAAVGALLPSMG